MINKIHGLIAISNKKTIETNRLQESLEREMGGEGFELAGGYEAFALSVGELCLTVQLSPVKNSGTNGIYRKSIELTSKLL